MTPSITPVLSELGVYQPQSKTVFLSNVS